MLCTVYWLVKKKRRREKKEMKLRQNREKKLQQLLKSLTTILGIEPVVVVIGRSPNIIVDCDGENNKENLVLNTTESVEDSVVKGTSKWLLSITRDRVSSNSLLSRGTY